LISNYVKQKLPSLPMSTPIRQENLLMSTGLSLPLLRDLVPGSIEYGTMLMVEFEPDALWYESSLTIAAQAVKEGRKTVYHVFEHPPDDVRSFLCNLGLDVEKLEDDGLFHIVDSFTVQTGLGFPKHKAGWTDGGADRSLRLWDWSLEAGQILKAGFREERKNWLHIDENFGILLQYNPEKLVVDFARTRALPEARDQKQISLHSFVKGVASESFYKQFESLCDGIIEFKTQEIDGEIGNLLRVRALRGRKHDTKWHKLELLDNGEVTVAD